MRRLPLLCSAVTWFHLRLRALNFVSAVGTHNHVFYFEARKKSIHDGGVTEVILDRPEFARVLEIQKRLATFLTVTTEFWRETVLQRVGIIEAKIDFEETGLGVKKIARPELEEKNFEVDRRQCLHKT